MLTLQWTLSAVAVCSTDWMLRCLHYIEHDLELLELCVYKPMFTLQWAWSGIAGAVYSTDWMLRCLHCSEHDLQLLDRCLHYSEHDLQLLDSCLHCSEHDLELLDRCLHCSEHDLQLLDRCLHCSGHDLELELCVYKLMFTLQWAWSGSCWIDVYIAVSMIWSCWIAVYIAVSMSWSCWSCGSGQDWSGVTCVVDCWLLWTAPLWTVTWQQRPESWTRRSRLESGSVASSHSKQQLLAHSLLSHISAIVVSVYIRGMAAFSILISLLLLCVLCVFPCHWLLDGHRCVCTSVDWEKLKTTITIIVSFITLFLPAGN